MLQVCAKSLACLCSGMFVKQCLGEEVSKSTCKKHGIQDLHKMSTFCVQCFCIFEFIKKFSLKSQRRTRTIG